MALPIKPTPKLDIKEFREFLEKIKEDLKKPAYLTPTPRLENARKIVRMHMELK